jgi:hypothetical protein
MLSSLHVPYLVVAGSCPIEVVAFISACGHVHDAAIIEQLKVGAVDEIVGR